MVGGEIEGGAFVCSGHGIDGERGEWREFQVNGGACDWQPWRTLAPPWSHFGPLLTLFVYLPHTARTAKE